MAASEAQRESFPQMFSIWATRLVAPDSTAVDGPAGQALVLPRLPQPLDRNSKVNAELLLIHQARLERGRREQSWPGAGLRVHLPEELCRSRRYCGNECGNRCQQSPFSYLHTSPPSSTKLDKIENLHLEVHSRPVDRL